MLSSFFWNIVLCHWTPVNVSRPCGDLIFKGQMFEAEFFTKSTNI
jgi:hypothetical protein